MDIFEVKRTPIVGLWEIAQLEPYDYDVSTPRGYLEIKPRNVELLFRFLGLHNVHDNSYRNPQQIDKELYWHLDGLDHPPEFMIFGIMTHNGSGTWFREGLCSAAFRTFQGKPWHLYLMVRDIEHAAPVGERYCDRLLLRYRFPRRHLYSWGL